MSIITENNRTDELTTDGSETGFDFDMLIHADTEVQVWYEVTGGNYTQLTLDTDYTVVFTDDGGTVTTTGASSPFAAGKILIIRHIALTQQTNWLYNDNHTEQAHQDDFDRSVMRDLQIQEELDRCAKFATSSSTTGVTLPEPAANLFLGWNAAGDDLENKTPDALGLTIAFDDLTDVDVGAPATGDVVQWTGAVWQKSSPGISDDDILEVDGSPNSGEYARFTANGLEGRTLVELAGELDHGNLEPSSLGDNDHPQYIVRSIDTDHFLVTAGQLGFSVNQDTNLHTWQGSFLEQIDFTISEAGGTVTGSLEKEGTGDLTMYFSDEFTALDCTPAITVDLTSLVGTDTSPATAYVYIPQSTKTLTAAASWPSAATEHIRVASIVLQSAATTGTNGALMNRNWNDYAFGITDPRGYGLHIGERLRFQHALWSTGVVLSITGSGTGTVTLDTTAGTVYQLHLQSFPAIDMAGADDIHLVNLSGSEYSTSVNLVADITTLADGVTAIANNKYFNIVVWGVQNRTGESSHMMCNLPTGQYTKSADATVDASKFSVHTIPSAFRGTGFLIAELTFQLTGGGTTWTTVQNKDLLGQTPTLTPGGGTTTDITTFSDSAFEVFDNGDDAKRGDFELSGVTTGNTRTLTWPDVNTKIWADDGSVPLTADWDVGDFSLTMKNLTIDGVFTDGNYTFDTSGNVSGLGTVGCGVITQSGTTLANTYHPKTTVGIADDNLVEIDDADAADNDYAKFTANGLEGRSFAEVKSDLVLEIGTDVLAQQTIGIADNNLLEVDGSPNSGEYARFTANGLEGRTEAEFKADFNLEIGTDVLAEQTIGIADDNLLEVDDADAADNDYAKFTANGLEGRSFAEVLTDLSGQAGAAFAWNSQNLTGVGTIAAGQTTLTGTAAPTLDVDGDSAGTVNLRLRTNSDTGACIYGVTAGQSRHFFEAGTSFSLRTALLADLVANPAVPGDNDVEVWNCDASGNTHAEAEVRADTQFDNDGTNGVDGTIGATDVATVLGGIITNITAGGHCPRLDAWIDSKWQEVGRAIYDCINTSDSRRWDITLTVPAQRFRLVEDEREKSTVTAIRGDGEDWGMGTIRTEFGTIVEFEFSKPVLSIETEGVYVLDEEMLCTQTLR